MAATVLGKRSRTALETEDNSITSPVAKRRTRRSAPQIYEDTLEDSQLEKQSTQTEPVKSEIVIRTNRTVRTRNTRGKPAIEDSPQETQASTSQPSDQDSLEYSDENLPPSSNSTPSVNRFKDALAFAPSTPKHRVRLAGRLPTPRSSRSSTPARSQNVYSQGRQLFTQASDGKIIGREAERHQLVDFITNSLESGIGGCTYVSGPPGTGKSALVQEIMQEFRQQSVKLATVNCVSLKTSVELLTQLVKEFGCGGKSPKTSLAKLFTTKKANSGMHLVLLDEIDTLLTGECEVLYSVFEWAMHPSSSLILVGIANALDLTDRFLPRLKSRNVKPQLLPFLPYSGEQIATIISGKLRSLLPEGTNVAADFVPLMHPAAIQLSGKKIASQTGDLRKAFNLVRRAIEHIEQETLLKMSREQSVTPTKQPLQEIPNLGMNQATPAAISDSVKMDRRSVINQLTLEDAPRATIGHVAKIAASVFNNGTMSRLAGLNLQQKAVLCSLVASEDRQHRRDPFATPTKSLSKIPTIQALFAKYAELCRRDEGLLQSLKNTEFRDVIASLETLGLVQDASGRSSSLLTPTSTPSRGGRGLDDRQVVSVVSKKELRDGLNGPGSDLLLRLLDQEL